MLCSLQAGQHLLLGTLWVAGLAQLHASVVASLVGRQVSSLLFWAAYIGGRWRVPTSTLDEEGGAVQLSPSHPSLVDLSSQVNPCNLIYHQDGQMDSQLTFLYPYNIYTYSPLTSYVKIFILFLG